MMTDHARSESVKRDAGILNKVGLMDLKGKWSCPYFTTAFPDNMEPSRLAFRDAEIFKLLFEKL